MLRFSPRPLAAEGMRPVTGGTDTHLALLDLQGIGVTGADAEARCDAAGIVLNKNAIPTIRSHRASPQVFAWNPPR